MRFKITQSTLDMIFSQLNISKMSSNSELSVQKFIHDQGIHLMALQETGCWDKTKGLFTDSLIIQNDISCKTSLKGVALIVKKTLLPEKVDFEEPSDFDAIWSQIRVGQKRILVGSIYISPSASNEAFEHLLKHLKSAASFKEVNKFSSLLVYGDFNARSLEWGDHHTNAWGRQLCDFLDKESLTLCSPFDLTFSCYEGGSVIDLLLADGPIVRDIGQHWVEKDCELFTGAPARGHYPVLHSLSIAAPHQGVKLKCHDWNKADWENWNCEVEAKLWGLELVPGLMQDGHKLWEEYLNIVQEANNKYVPLKTVSIHSKPFWTEKLSESLKQFLTAKGNYQKRSTPYNKEKMREAKDVFSQELITEKNNWVKRRVENVNVNDSTQFWKKYKKVFGINQHNYIGNLASEDSCLITSDAKKERLLYSTFFTGRHLSQLRTDPNHEKVIDNQYKSLLMDFNNNETINDSLNCNITEAEVIEVIKTINHHDKSCDDDRIHPCILKKLGSTAITTLTSLFNWCLRTGNWIWTTSRVTFIRKEGKNTYTKPDSYRPISMSSYFGKVLERILDTRLRIFMELERKLDDDQEGFTAGRSTTRYLFRMIANLSGIKKKKLTCIILFIDFQKAFDSVHLPTLMIKLNKLGVQGRILKLLHSFLFDRKVKLKVNDFVGEPILCSIFGLPQGSVLSPLLFIIYVADMTDEIPQWLKERLCCYKFADDGTLLVAHQSLFQCYRLMQRLCNELSKWCQKNKLVINCDINKTEAIILKTGQPLSEDNQPPQLHINGKNIRYVEKTKVLGVIVDDQLNFRCHAKQKLNECTRKWGLITKSTNRNHGLNIRSLTLLWKTMILTKLMYAAPLWLWKNLEVFKSFWQKAFMKMTGAFLCPNRALTEMALHLPPLEVILDVQTAKFMCKVLTSDDFLTCTLLQIEGSIPDLFHQQIVSLKEFIHWRYPEELGRRTHKVDLLEVKHKGYSLHYTKEVIQMYQEHRWKRLATGRLNVLGSSNTTDRVENLLFNMGSPSKNMDKNNFLFNHKTTKKEDSHIMDFIHGNSPLFGNCRKRMSITNEDKCDFCQQFWDSPLHQLFWCKELQDQSHTNLMEVITNPESYVTEVLLPKDKNVQQRFIERIRFLIDQHDFVYELKSDNSESSRI